MENPIALGWFPSKDDLKYMKLSKKKEKRMPINPRPELAQASKIPFSVLATRLADQHSKFF
jgi:hypothetical protein